MNFSFQFSRFTFFYSLSRSPKPNNYVSKLIITGIWIISIIFAIPIAVALRVFPVVEERTCKKGKIMKIGQGHACIIDDCLFQMTVAE